MNLQITGLFTAIAVLLAGCVSVDSKPVAQPLAEAPLPSWSVGDAEVWSDHDGSNQHTHRVVAVDGERVSWQSDNNDSWTDYRNFALPAPAWDAKKFGKGTQEILSTEGELYPLKVGNTMTISFKGTSSKYPEGWSLTEHCKVRSQENVTVPAGSFDTFRIDCANRGTSRTWYYAPALGTNVIFIRQSQGDHEHYVLHSVTRNAKS